jgi:hypothetical protein
MHPTIGQALAAERVRDWRARAERARCAKIDWRSRISRPAACSTPPKAIADPGAAPAAGVVMPTAEMRRQVADGARSDRRAA